MVDYSKWNSMDCSDSDGEDGQTSNTPRVTRLDQPSSITFGGNMLIETRMFMSLLIAMLIISSAALKASQRQRLSTPAQTATNRCWAGAAAPVVDLVIECPVEPSSAMWWAKVASGQGCVQRPTWTTSSAAPWTLLLFGRADGWTSTAKRN